MECLEFEVKSEIGKLFMNEKSLKNILLGFMKLIFFYEDHKEIVKVNKNGREYILFRIKCLFY